MNRMLLSAFLAFAVISSTSARSAEPEGKPKATVVLVHGAFADGSSWNKVIPLLQAKGLHVVSVQNPLSSLAEDVTQTKRVLDAEPGPIVLVGHSWGGAVITEAGNHDKVKALVYVAAFAPDAGEAGGDIGKNFPPPPGLAHPIASADGYLTLSADTVAKDFAQDVGPEEANLIAVTQGPINSKAFDSKISKAAWSTRPSWYIVAKNDRMIQPDAERAYAKRMKATTTELDSSHVPMVSQPQAVADVIVAAADSIK
jgi:pimeloyl-ACP methyl ester carboxylesterase